MASLIQNRSNLRMLSAQLEIGGLRWSSGTKTSRSSEMATMMTMKQICGAAARRMMMKVAPSSTPTISVAVDSAPVMCGRGDKRTKKGKRFKGSYGNSRPKKDKMIERIKDRVEVPRSTPWPLPFKLI